jgi:hypothetical protein
MPGCGEGQLANALDRRCGRCLTRQAMTGYTLDKRVDRISTQLTEIDKIENVTVLVDMTLGVDL